MAGQYPGLTPREQERGIVHPEGIAFHTPSDFAREHLVWISFGAASVCRPPYKIEREGFDSFILFLIDGGALEFAYEGKRFTARAGDVVLLDARCPQRYWAGEETAMRWLHLWGGCLPGYYARIMAQGGNLHPAMAGAVGGWADMVLAGVRAGDMPDDEIAIALMRILSALAGAGRARPSHPAVRAARHLLESRFAEPLDVEDIAAHAASSRYHLTRLFRAEMGCGLHAYLLKVRLGHAKHLLSETDEPVGTVALRCGFTSASHFIRAFKQQEGMTPSRFRDLF